VVLQCKLRKKTNKADPLHTELLEPATLSVIIKIAEARRFYINFLKFTFSSLIPFLLLALSGYDPVPAMAAFYLPCFAYAIIKKKFSSPPCPYCGRQNCFVSRFSSYPSKTCVDCQTKLVD
jgi:hypothetical protein